MPHDTRSTGKGRWPGYIRPETPELRITPISFNCQHCGKKFPNLTYKIEARFCSKKCFYASGGTMREPEVRKKMGKSRRGQSAPNRGKYSHFWKGGISDKHGRDKYRVEIRKWRYAVLERDKYKCRKCGKLGTKDYGLHVGLDVAHIKPWSDYPKLRFKISNGITWCRDCHVANDKKNKHIGWQVLKGRSNVV